MDVNDSSSPCTASNHSRVADCCAAVGAGVDAHVRAHAAALVLGAISPGELGHPLPSTFDVCELTSAASDGSSADATDLFGA